MAAALAEARGAMAAGQRPRGAVAVLDEAMVASGHDQVARTGDPTAHAVVMALREAAQRLGRADLTGLIVFPSRRAVRHVRRRIAREPTSTASSTPRDPAARNNGRICGLGHRRLRVVSGIMQAEAAELSENMPAGTALPSA